jgi:1-aminocyclopropane-1-carboxylate deaminase
MLKIQQEPYNQEVSDCLLQKKEIKLFVKREDLLHEHISGNKFRKLYYNMIAAKEKAYDTLLTFGGAFSNHIAATAAAGNEYGFKTIGVIRGDELGEDLAKTLAHNPTLRFAQEQGMRFHFVTRAQYRQKTTATFIKNLYQLFGQFYLVPEGGTNQLAVKGTEEILTKNDAEFDYICSAIGTGGTIAGIINSALPHQKVLGFPVLKENFLHNDIQKYVHQDNWTLIRDYNRGGFGKIDAELVDFINMVNDLHNLPLDPVYTGKMMFGIIDLIKKDYFPKGSKILAIHSGGLQGRLGMNFRLQKKGMSLIKL